MRERGLLHAISVEEVSGLRPKAWVVVGAGFAREDVKTELLRDSRGLVAEAMTHLQEICARALGASRESILDSASRQDVLRMLLGVSKNFSYMPELKRLRRQSGFFKKLDRAIQGGRLAAAHEEEALVHLERLVKFQGQNPLREEIFRLAAAYEEWLKGSELWDLPRLIRSGIDVFQDGWPMNLPRPEKIYDLSAQFKEGLEQNFWDTIRNWVEVQEVGPLHKEALDPSGEFEWERWHALDDASEAVADALVTVESLSEYAVLIPDQPAIRRSLTRALRNRSIPLEDPRDPTRLRWEEEIKWALLPLQVVAKQFERLQVSSYLRWNFPDRYPEWMDEIHQRGIRRGLGFYRGGKLNEVFEKLSQLKTLFGERQLCRELSEAHLNFIRENVSEDDPWLYDFFTLTWNELIQDLERIGQDQRKAPLLHWLDHLQTRIEQASPPVQAESIEDGLRLLRLQQAPGQKVQKLLVLGLGQDFFSGDGAGDYWLTDRDREILSGEFQVRSKIQLRKERIATLRHWFEKASEIRLFDYSYDWDGRERPSLKPIFLDLEIAPPESKEMGAHSRWFASFQALRPVQNQEVLLPSLQKFGVQEIRATDVENYSKCGLVGLASGRWRLWDVQEPSADLWPAVKGNILHKAVELLLRSREGRTSRFGISLKDALDEAWETIRPKGLLKGDRLAAYTKRKLMEVLEAFVEKEAEYLNRAKVDVISLETDTLRLQLEGFSVMGRPDRIDENGNGLFIIDYKTSSVAPPSGKDMLNEAYRLQLPFYALAARTQFKRPVAGLQFLELTKKAGRTKGVFFNGFNGKEEGCFTQVRRNSTSLFAEEPDEIWSRFMEEIETVANGFYSGKYSAHPNPKENCDRCRFNDLCGRRRLAGDETEGVSR